MALRLRRGERADAGHLGGEVERERAVGGEGVDLLGDGEVPAVEEQRRASDDVDRISREAKHWRDRTS